MANIAQSLYMNLPVPVVGVDPSPTWGTDLNNCLTLIDSHSHISGSGVPITSAAININADLSFNSNNLTTALSLGFATSGSDPSGLGLLYYKGVDLYFNDGSSNHIRITQSGAVTGASGTITGLPSGTASAAYVSGSQSFVFQSATNTAANIDVANVIIRNGTASSHSLTISPPSAMGSDTTITLPTLPASTSILNITSGGTFGTTTADAIGQGMTATGANAVANSRTRPLSASAGIGQIAQSTTGNVTLGAATTLTNIPALGCTLQTSGRPVMMTLNPIAVTSGTAWSWSVGKSISGTGSVGAFIAFTRDSSIVAIFNLAANITVSGTFGANVPGGINFIDYTVPAGGAYSYGVQYMVTGTNAYTTILPSQLMCYEL